MDGVSLTAICEPTSRLLFPTDYQLITSNLTSYAIIFNFTVPLMIKKWNIRAVWLFVCLGIP